MSVLSLTCLEESKEAGVAIGIVRNRETIKTGTQSKNHRKGWPVVTQEWR